MKDKKKKTALTIIAAVTLMLTIIGATYAYFVGQVGGGGGSRFGATTGTTDNLVFIAGDPIVIHATMDNFKQGMESLKDNTTASAKLLPNNSTNTASARYNIFLIIDNNNFEYSTDDKQAEIVVKVTDPNGNEVQQIEGLKRTENGFDITTRTGGYLIRSDYDIETDQEEGIQQDWQVEVTLVNLNVNQKKNFGKTLNAKVYITKDQESTYETAKISSIIPTTSYNSIKADLNIKQGTSEIEKYYFAIEEVATPIAYNETGIKRLSNTLASLEWIEGTEPTYTFSGLKDNTPYKISSYGVDKNGISTNTYEDTITTAEYVLPKVTDVVVTKVELYSLTIEATSEKGNNDVAYYQFSKDDGVTWSEKQESNVYVFDNLNDTTEYKIKVKVIDTQNRESAEYYEPISTQNYEIPKITKVEATTSWNKVTLNVTAEGGTNSITKYYYKKKDDTNWTELTTSTHTFESLNEKTPYNFEIKVTDTKERESLVYEISATTDEYKIPKVNNVEVSEGKGSLTLTVTAEDGTGRVVSYAYSKDDGSNWTDWIEQNTYTFSDLTPNVEFPLRVKVKDENDIESTIYETTGTVSGPSVVATVTYNTSPGAPTKVGPLANLSCPGTTSSYNVKYSRIEISNMDSGSTNCTLNYSDRTEVTKLNDHIISLAGTTQGNGQVINEKGYRYEGKNPDNYVWFNNELWRIIGVFNESSHGQTGMNLVKIIREEPLGGLAWDKSRKNNWNTSSLKALLNGAYYNQQDGTESGYCYGYSSAVKANCDYSNIGIDSSYRPMVKNVTWYLGGNNGSTITIDSLYNNERGATVYGENLKKDTGYIGLMYASDYGYSPLASSCARKTTMNSYKTPECAGESWLYGNGYEWTITPDTKSATYGWHIISDGRLFLTGDINEGLVIRPVLYLDESVYLIEGKGTEKLPYIIGI